MAAETLSRGIVEMTGVDARALLQRLITNDVDALAPGEARYAALLSPQGKILVDFIVVSCPTAAEPERFLIDCPRGAAADLAKRLTMYRLRAKVTIVDRSHELDAIPLPAQIEAPSPVLVIYADPRHPALGFRAIGQLDIVAALRVASADPERRRIEAGVPDGGVDFAFGDTFPHEANLDRLNGVDFAKGCYVGQEVVSRMQHRSTTRKRIVPVAFNDDAPPRGADIKAGALAVGTMGSASGQRGLALLRLDRVAEAETPLVADGRTITVVEA